MPQFTYTGSQEMVYPTLAAADGSTLVVKPGDVVTLDAAPDADFVSGKAAKAVAAPETPSDAPQSPATPTPDPSTPESA